MEFTIQFTEKQLEVLNLALQELPFKLAAPLFESINKQINQQVRGETIPEHVTEIVED